MPQGGEERPGGLPQEDEPNDDTGSMVRTERLEARLGSIFTQ
jgi:hypothetical protein